MRRSSAEPPSFVHALTEKPSWWSGQAGQDSGKWQDLEVSGTAFEFWLLESASSLTWKLELPRFLQPWFAGIKMEFPAVVSAAEVLGTNVLFR